MSIWICPKCRTASSNVAICQKCGNPKELSTLTVSPFGGVQTMKVFPNPESDKQAVACQRRVEKLALAEMLADTITRLILRGYDGPCMGEEFRPVMELLIKYDTYMD